MGVQISSATALCLTLGSIILLFTQHTVAGEETSRNKIAVAIEEGLVSSLGKSGFVENVSVSLEGCDLAIHTDFARICSPENSGALLTLTDFIDLSELSNDPADFEIGLLSIGVLGLTWDFKQELRFHWISPTSPPTDQPTIFGGRKELAQKKLRSQSIRQSCLVPVSIQPLVGRVSLFFDNAIDPNLEVNLRLFKEKYCK